MHAMLSHPSTTAWSLVPVQSTPSSASSRDAGVMLPLVQSRAAALVTSSVSKALVKVVTIRQQEKQEQDRQAEALAASPRSPASGGHVTGRPLVSLSSIQLAGGANRSPYNAAVQWERVDGIDVGSPVASPRDAVVAQTAAVTAKAVVVSAMAAVTQQLASGARSGESAGGRGASPVGGAAKAVVTSPSSSTAVAAPARVPALAPAPVLSTVAPLLAQDGVAAGADALRAGGGDARTATSGGRKSSASAEAQAAAAAAAVRPTTAGSAAAVHVVTGAAPVDAEESFQHLLQRAKTAVTSLASFLLGDHGNGSGNGGNSVSKLGDNGAARTGQGGRSSAGGSSFPLLGLYLSPKAPRRADARRRDRPSRDRRGLAASLADVEPVSADVPVSAVMTGSGRLDGVGSPRSDRDAGSGAIVGNGHAELGGVSPQDATTGRRSMSRSRSPLSSRSGTRRSAAVDASGNGAVKSSRGHSRGGQPVAASARTPDTTAQSGSGRRPLPEARAAPIPELLEHYRSAKPVTRTSRVRRSDTGRGEGIASDLAGVSPREAAAATSRPSSVRDSWRSCVGAWVRGCLGGCLAASVCLLVLPLLRSMRS